MNGDFIILLIESITLSAYFYLQIQYICIINMFKFLFLIIRFQILVACFTFLLE